MGDTQEFRAKVTSCAKWTGKVCGLISILFSLKGIRRATAELAYQFPLGEWQRLLTQLNRQFPTISLLDIGAI